MFFLSMPFVVTANRQRDVDHAQESENKSLDHADQGSHKVERHWNNQLGQAYKRAYDLMVPHHVAEKTERQRDRSKPMGKGFQDEEEDHRDQQHRKKSQL